MPHVKITYPHRTKSGQKRAQGQVVYLSSAEAKTVVADGKGKIVTPTPEEILELAGKKVPAKPASPEPEPAPKALPKRPARKDEPADG